MPDQGERADRRWLLWLALITAIGLGIRLAAVFGRADPLTISDAYYYSRSANALASGLGFINPFDYYLHNAHQHVPTAAFPPMFTFLLFPASLFGFKSFFAHRIWTSILGTAGIALCGFTGKEIGGRRVGLVTALLVAIYPNIWMPDGLVLSEAISPLIIGFVLLAAYRFWRRPQVVSAVVLGVSIGVAALARDELTLLGVFVLLPLALLARLGWRRRFLLLAVGGLTAALVVSPWVGYNLSRFDDTTFISTGLGATLVSANCKATWYGQYEGYWSFACALAAPIKPKSATVDESVQDVEGRHIAWRFIDSRIGQFPGVALTRIGRTFGFYRPIQQIQLDATVENRPYGWAEVGLGSYYALSALAVGGLIILRRRKVPVFPLLAIGVTVVISVVVTFGQTRYRSTFEISLVILGAVTLSWFGDLFRRTPRAQADGPPAEAPIASEGDRRWDHPDPLPESSGDRSTGQDGPTNSPVSSFAGEVGSFARDVGSSAGPVDDDVVR